MKILIIIQSSIPKERHDECLSVLKKTIRSIKSQDSGKKWSIEIVLSDDGSDYLNSYAKSQINILNNEIVERINKKYDLGVDKIMLIKKNSCFNKADLFNYYLKAYGNLYDICIFFDDDHPLIRNDSLDRFVRHYKNGYNFVVGRLCNPNGKFRSLYDKTVQGTTFALTCSLLEEVGYWSERVKKWGCGDDPEMFWKLYKKHEEGKVKAIYDGNIITMDLLSGRWGYCLKQAGGMNFFIEDFSRIYGVHPHVNNSRDKKRWMDTTPDNNGINEKLFIHINIDEYLSYNNKKKKSYLILWYLRFYSNFFRRSFLFLKRKLCVNKKA